MLRRRRHFPEGSSPALRRAKIAMAIVIPLVMAASLLYTSRTDHEICAVCYSSRSTSSRGFGTDPENPWVELQRFVDIRPSDVCTEFFAGACPHRWKAFSRRVSVFCLMSMSGGTARQQPMAEQYQNWGRFHDIVGKRIKDGSIPADDFRDACLIPADPTPADLADPERRRLIAFGTELLRVFGDRNSEKRWAEALASAPR